MGVAGGLVRHSNTSYSSAMSAGSSTRGAGAGEEGEEGKQSQWSPEEDEEMRRLANEALRNINMSKVCPKSSRPHVLHPQQGFGGVLLECIVQVARVSRLLLACRRAIQ